MARALTLVRDHGGRVHDDLEAAERWRTAFIRMPYNREILVPLDIIADTFETAITWDRFQAFHDQVKSATERAIVEATGAAGLVTCRFTHVYPDGPAPYFSFHAKGGKGALLAQWAEIKKKASDAIIRAGGTITHHHAVGRDHMPWYRKQQPSLFGHALAAAKQVLDPKGIMNPGVIVPLKDR
jgi:alkyldihydroxyacetonephosphate synthase